MLQAYVYIRFSTPKQEKGSSKERQLDDCRSHCARKGWAIVEELEDLGRSAWKGDHLKSGELGKFAARVYAGEILPGSVLVVEKLDRLSRQDVRFTQRWLEDLCSAGISIATVSGDRLYDDDTLRKNLMSTLEVLLIGKLAHDESENKSERSGDNWRRKQEKTKVGVVMTTKTPGWLRVKHDRSGLETIADRVAVLNDVYQMAADGHGARAIAKSLNTRGVPSWGDPRKSGKLIGWTPGFIGDLLVSPAVEGEYHPNYRAKKGNRSGSPVLGYYPPVVNADLVARARTAAAGRKGTGGRNGHNFANLFSGMAYCSHCQGKMVMRRNPVKKADGTKRYDANLQCGNAYNGLVCNRREFFNYGKFEPAALEAILHLALEDRFFQQGTSSVLLTIKVAEFEKELVQKRAEASRLVRLAARMEDEGEVDEIEKDLRSTRRAIKEGEAALETARGDLVKARGEVTPAEHLQRVMDVRDAVEHRDDETRIAARRKVHEALKALVDQVRCDAAEDFRGEVRRTITIIMSGGMLAVKFDNAGRKLGSVNASGILRTHSYEVDGEIVTTNEDAARRGITGGDPIREARLDALERRRVSAPRTS